MNLKILYFAIFALIVFIFVIKSMKKTKEKFAESDDMSQYRKTKSILSSIIERIKSLIFRRNTINDDDIDETIDDIEKRFNSI